MLTLCLDTTDARYFLGLSREGALENTVSGTAGRALDTEIFPALKALMARGNADLDKVERIAVSIGPGSFVGTRIGLAIANTLARVRAIPVLGIGVLDVLSALGPEEEGATFFCALNCVRDEVFWQKFARRDGVASPQGEIDVRPFDDFAAIGAGVPVIFRAPQMRNTLAFETLNRLSALTLIDGKDAFASLARVAHARRTSGADGGGSTLPTPLYIKPETTRRWQP
ncbi:tRNA (adenosine(37)-N6)-threonylcarbamoyltransferase complex dimerization subunit type 1 TsaB [Varunaivibrio sulfuroxidans]|uniref:tRNA threonylcarbamoyl adenosine modification protein YeaZ n=1 Tax=Varunaivibrio sulfuroxidans TaxID=1773489 RepID=A0A4R3JAU3_9PROT|nr:tRNA (adenosine(37)-N6)-threonylcarbamoyltransferase complex dimerization subunit type 1 TsaB [Varunaivibrio sulfuroxidans]TCS61780.1 tRNA threonylcarbamoyl adenosine modification protein YeaZ [Varunaivibrio sulfuroxidans]WES32037.1 tRNA (adenosine(37)-N6)-threonylcarbamoyltransferase complex dimerization subunit type 1 TsaB [Varunaivibrio sulfuroxidans]